MDYGGAVEWEAVGEGEVKRAGGRAMDQLCNFIVWADQMTGVLGADDEEGL